ncbi:MAG TPA: caspase family protein [Oligoflexus sp.]|uniref:caspase family protein n=1 Tax=Oligoflexus sp. TaxID=1971216 RepID=UPI002D3B031E|nr:caspase family protein [Oligoflexus sp.]HYX34673.1 caspase family protein [Oligoflexus sp.]
MNQYKDSFWTPLKWAQVDARKVIDKLGQGTGYIMDRRILVDADASLDNIKRKLIEVSQEVRKQDTVILYISSHGTLSMNQEGLLGKYVVTHDTRHEQLGTTGLSHAFLKNWADSLSSSRNLMIFASCHSGVGKSRLSPEISALLAQRKGPTISLAEVSEGILILSAAAEGEAAHESPSLQGDVYTHFLIEALETYDRNQDGLVTALEAHDYAQEKAWSYSQGRQRATFEAKSIGKADIPLKGQSQRPGLPVLKAYLDHFKDFSLRINDGVKGRLPMAFPLKPKKNIIKIFSPDSEEAMAVYEVDAVPGEAIDLETILQPDPFEVRLDLGSGSWQDPIFPKLAGQTSTLAWTAGAYWHYRNWSLGLMHQPPIEATGTLRPGLKSRMKTELTQLTGAYTFKLSNAFALESGLGVGQQDMAITFQDEFGQSMPFDESSLLLSADLRLTWRPQGSLAWSVWQRFSDSSWDYGRIGKLSGRRWETGLGMGWHFGGKARRVQ